MTLEEVQKKIFTWEKTLSTKEKKHIHLHSFINFIVHFGELSDSSRKKILPLFCDYIDLVESMNFSFDKDESYDIARDFLDKIADFYKDIGFKLNMKISFVFFWGIIFDVGLFILNILPEIKNLPVPIVTGLLFSYYLYIAIFKKPKKLVYGIFY